jgi:predicted Zn-dependent protease
MSFRNAVNDFMLKKFFICLLLFLVSCAVNPVTGKQEFMIVSEQREIEIGKEAAPSLNWDFGGQYHDQALEIYLNRTVNHIWQNSERSYLPVKFYIQNTSVPNAFALPGYVAITRGLLCDLENEAQFAAVMGHETGHVMARHTASRISRSSALQLGLAFGQQFLKSNRGADVLMAVGAIGSSLYLLSYDREQEIQADRLGVNYMAKLGYDPNEALTAHNVLETSVDNYLRRMGKSRDENNFLTNLLSTHPRKEVRLSEIQSMINDLPAYNITGDGKSGARFQTEIKRIKEINQIYFIYDEAEKYYQEGNFKSAELRLEKAISLNKEQAPFYNLLGFVKLQQKDYKTAKSLYDTALSIDAGYQPAIYGLGLISFYQSDYQSAIYEFKRSLNLYPNHPGTHFGMGKSYFFLRRYKEAIPYLRGFAEAVPNDPEVHGLVGICYENTGDIESAVQEYRYQIKIAPDTELGTHARKRLAALEPQLKQ